MDDLTRRRLIAAGGATLVTGFGAAPVDAATPPVLDNWLRAYPTIAKAIVWDFGKGLQPYAAWAEPSKARLRAAYSRAWNNEPSGLSDPPPNQLTFADKDWPRTELDGEQAFSLHIAHVGNNLATEIGRRVPWSISDMPEQAVLILLSGFHFFRRTKAGNYVLVPVSVPAPPDATLAFLRAQKIIGASRRATIVNMLAWCRDRMTHFMGSGEAKNFEDHWQYRGFPPASRVISPTRYTGPAAQAATTAFRRHYTAGCGGTTGFLAATLRAVNIPVQLAWATQISRYSTQQEAHSAAYFMSEELCLSHSDDPYNVFCRIQPSFDIGEILITKTQFDAWFPPGATPTAGQPRNVGRRVHDLAVQHLPIYAMNLYAQDVAEKKSRTNGKVFEMLKQFSTMAELEAAQLWQRLDKRLAELGGPDKVREIYAEGLRKHTERTETAL